ncbi:hypothetical protein Nizo3892_1746 [Lactiplantibacillus plantarum]|nr:hypothetical protein Nizo3892_1746 [Lactiplantibacillus plantarum]
MHALSTSTLAFGTSEPFSKIGHDLLDFDAYQWLYRATDQSNHVSRACEP